MLANQMGYNSADFIIGNAKQNSTNTDALYCSYSLNKPYFYARNYQRGLVLVNQYYQCLQFQVNH